jgi:hypothetical protein
MAKKIETNLMHISRLSKLNPYGLTSFDCIKEIAFLIIRSKK